MRPVVRALAFIGLAVFMFLPVLVVALEIRHPWKALFLGVALVIAMCLPWVIHDWLCGLRRRRGLMALAEKMGLGYADLDFSDLPARYRATRLFTSNRAGKASRIISGPVGDGRVACFDYGSTAIFASATTNMSVCAFHCPCSFKKLYIRPEGKGEISPADIDLDLAAFNNAFYVECEDRKFAYEILSQRAMQFLLDHPRMSMEMAEDYFLLYRDPVQHRGLPALPVAELERLIIYAKEFAGLLPNYLKKTEVPASTTMPAP